MMDMVRFLEQIDLSILSRKWENASDENTKYMQKHSKSNASFFIVVQVVGIITSILMPVLGVIAMIIDGEFDALGFMGICAISLFCFCVVFFRGKRTIGRYNQREIKVEQKLVVLHSIFKGGKAGVILHLCEWTEENEIVMRHIPLDSMSYMKRGYPRQGEVMTLLKTSNYMVEAKRYAPIRSALIAGDSDLEPFQKMAEQKFFEGDDHRKIEFYVKKTSSNVRFLAIKQRLDISDDAVVTTKNRYFLEEYSVEEAKDPKLFSDFMNRMMQSLKSEMKES